MKTKIGLFLALAAAVLSFVAPAEKKAILKMFTSTSIITNLR